MTIQLTQDQKDFQEAIRAFVDKEIIPVARDMEHSGEYPTAIVEHMKEMGLFGMTIPEEFGGLGVDMTTFSIVFEELSRGWMGVAGVLGSHSMASPPRVSIATPIWTARRTSSNTSSTRAPIAVQTTATSLW